MKEHKLTLHALDRLKERSTLEPGDILSAIHDGQVEIITAEQYTNRVSHLFFSASEEKFHILVIDTSTQEIITIMPIEYWENLKARTKGDRIRNGKSVKLGDLFNAVRKVDVDHHILRHPPLCGREEVHFFARITEKKIPRTKKVGRIAISDFIKLEKNICIKTLQSCLENGIRGLILDSELITVLWATTAKGAAKNTDRQYDLQFNFQIDFDTLYRAVVSDLCSRIENTNRYPEFQSVIERKGNG